LTANAFTTRYTQHSNVLVNEVRVVEPFDPSTDPPGKGQEFKAIWDTGATHSVITQRVVDALQLEPVDLVKISHAHGTGVAEVYIVNIELPNRVGFRFLRVTKGVLTGADLLIGMDVIGAGDFAVSNFGGKTTFTFRIPSLEEIDFLSAKPEPAKSEKISRNSPCPCGSGKKYKQCCGAP
jgi:hypothetical protein